MPNWCSNTVELKNTREKVEQFENFLNDNEGKNWFDFFAPCPKELLDLGDVSLVAEPIENQEELLEKYGATDWYTWSVNNWGCKWNCDAQSWHVEEAEDGKFVIKFWFDSPWGPPDTLYEMINDPAEDGGWTVYAEWNEEGMQFVGYFDEGFGDTYEYSDVASLDDVPEFLVENWNLRENLEQWEEDNEFFENDEENNDGKSN